MRSTTAAVALAAILAPALALPLDSNLIPGRADNAANAVAPTQAPNTESGFVAAGLAMHLCDALNGFSVILFDQTIECDLIPIVPSTASPEHCDAGSDSRSSSTASSTPSTPTSSSTPGHSHRPSVGGDNSPPSSSSASGHSSSHRPSVGDDHSNSSGSSGGNIGTKHDHSASHTYVAPSSTGDSSTPSPTTPTISPSRSPSPSSTDDGPVFEGGSPIYLGFPGDDDTPSPAQTSTNGDHSPDSSSSPDSSDDDGGPVFQGGSPIYLGFPGDDDTPSSAHSASPTHSSPSHSASPSHSHSASAPPSSTGAPSTSAKSTGASPSGPLDLLKVALGSGIIDLKKPLGNIISVGLLKSASAASTPSATRSALPLPTDLTHEVPPHLNAALPAVGKGGAPQTSHVLPPPSTSHSLLAAASESLLHVGVGNAVSDAAKHAGSKDASALSSTDSASDSLLRLVLHGSSSTLSGALSRATGSAKGTSILHAGVHGASKTVAGALSQETSVLPGVDAPSSSHPAGAIAAALHSSTEHSVADGVSSSASTAEDATKGRAPLVHAGVDGATGAASHVIPTATSADSVDDDFHSATKTATIGVYKATETAESSSTDLIAPEVSHATGIPDYASAAAESLSDHDSEDDANDGSILTYVP